MKLVIDGNIGSGKTTQLTKLEEKGFRVKREPIDEWPLELYYSDPIKWGLYFQLIVLKSHSYTFSDCSGIYERFPGSGTQVFWPLMEKNSAEDSVYQEMYKRHGWNPDVYIWINTSPEQCLNNMKNRKQSGDTSVSLEYLEKAIKRDEKYKDLPSEIYEQESSITDIKMTILDIVLETAEKQSGIA